MTTRGIPTMHDGIQFRSRLEARWATFFTLCGWRWTYEPFDADGYIPDFLIHGEMPVLVEVKPAVTRDEMDAPMNRMTAALRNHWNRDILVVGVSLNVGFDERPVILGMHGEPLGGDPCTWGTGYAEMGVCRECGAYAFASDTHCYSHRPCGHYDGNSARGKAGVKHPLDLWKIACNTTQWRKPASPAEVKPSGSPQRRWRNPVAAEARMVMSGSAERQFLAELKVVAPPETVQRYLTHGIAGVGDPHIREEITRLRAVHGLSA